MQLILRQGRTVDPFQKLNKVVDIGIEDGRVVEIAPKISQKGTKGDRCARTDRASRIH